MGRAKQLSCTEIGKVQVLKEEGYSNREIARRLNRSEFVIRSYLKNKENYGKLYEGVPKRNRTNFLVGRAFVVPRFAAKSA
ncbi:hypothetical protein ANTPLA_LOCUS10542 [Anthophora plagiata]